MALGIIGGTGIMDLSVFQGWKWGSVNTMFGEIEYASGKLDQAEAVLIPRHGSEHSIPPHMVNYKAVVAGARALGVRQMIGTAAVGSINENLYPGSIAVLTDFIDFTKCRKNTFFDQPGFPVVHTDFTNPYCPQLSQALIKASCAVDVAPVTPCTYICVDGPRYETPSEIRTYRSWGADVVGMTNVPEVVLARECGICYAAIAVVTNYGCGISPQPLSHEEVLSHMKAQDRQISRLLPTIPAFLTEDSGCRCGTNWEVFGSLMART